MRARLWGDGLSPRPAEVWTGRASAEGALSTCGDGAAPGVGPAAAHPAASPQESPCVRPNAQGQRPRGTDHANTSVKASDHPATASLESGQRKASSDRYTYHSRIYNNIQTRHVHGTGRVHQGHKCMEGRELARLRERPLQRRQEQSGTVPIPTRLPSQRGGGSRAPTTDTGPRSPGPGPLTYFSNVVVYRFIIKLQLKTTWMTVTVLPGVGTMVSREASLACDPERRP